MDLHRTGTGDESLVILQSLLCLLREKNVLSRADIEELTERVAMRAAQAERDPLPCCAEVEGAKEQEQPPAPPPPKWPASGNMSASITAVNTGGREGGIDVNRSVQRARPIPLVLPPGPCRHRPSRRSHQF